MALEDFKFYKIRLDRADMTMAAPLTAKEGAVNGNGIELQVINGSTIEDMSNFAVYLNWKHQTTGVQGSEPFTLVDVNNAVYRLHYPTEMLVGGVVRADIKVVDAESVTVSTAELSIRVAQAATDTAVQSENAWNDIQAILVQNQANATRMSEIEAELANVPIFDEIASKPTNEATAATNTVLASNGDGTGTFKDAGAIISGATAKVTPVDADTVALSDSAASGALKKLSWANIKATLKAYLDTSYAAITHGHNQSDIANLTTDLAGKAPTAHGHSIGDVEDLQTALNGKEPTFIKNTAFNKNFGTEAGTVTEGNDARLSDPRAPIAHVHDDRYYTETEVDAAFAPKTTYFYHADIDTLNESGFYQAYDWGVLVIHQKFDANYAQQIRTEAGTRKLSFRTKVGGVWGAWKDLAPSDNPTFTGLITTGGQIKFPATQVPSADANTLDDYEEGAWTPTITNITITGTNQSVFKYTKIGRLVFVNMKFQGSTNVAIAENADFTLPIAADDGVSGVASSMNTGEWAEFSLLTSTKIIFKAPMQGGTIQLSFFYICA